MTIQSRAKTIGLTLGALALTVLSPLSIANGGYQMLNQAPALSGIIEPLYTSLAIFYLAISPLAFLIFGAHYSRYARQIFRK